MKTILSFLFMLFLFFVKAQSNFTKDEQGYVKHFTAGYMVGYTSNAITWKLTGKKNLSCVVGIGASLLVGHLKEVYDRNHGKSYNNKDLMYTGIGGAGGSITIRLILIRFHREKDVIPPPYMIRD